jgi:diguanylate cyclase (GGDEF)-like protein
MEKQKNMLLSDKMTGTYNRKSAYKILNKQINIAKLEGESFVVCYVDVDNLKKNKNTFGYAEGERLINSVESKLKDSTRASDYLFRMGGDEFLILFTGAKIEHADILMSRLREKLNGQKIKDSSIDFCFGFSQFDPNGNMTADEIIKAADAKMYEEKRQITQRP